MHLIRKDPASRYYYVKDIGAIDDSKGFLHNVDENTDPKHTILVSFNMEAKFWMLDDFTGIEQIIIVVFLVIIIKKF